MRVRREKLERRNEQAPGRWAICRISRNPCQEMDVEEGWGQAQWPQARDEKKRVEEG